MVPKRKYEFQKYSKNLSLQVMEALSKAEFSINGNCF